ncbi:MAG: hypothetical protein ACJ8F7_21420 [Gemmataceae bacterium]
MKRIALTLFACVGLALPLRAEPPAGPGPRLAVASVDKAGNVVIDEVVLETLMVQQTRTVEENGVKRTVAVNVPLMRQSIRRQSHDGKKVSAFDMDGRPITPGRLASLLREPKAVAISMVGGKLGAPFRAALRDDVVVLVLPPPPEPVP